jgi:hypothetical protein
MGDDALWVASKPHPVMVNMTAATSDAPIKEEEEK